MEEEKKRHDRPQEDVLKSLKDAKNALKRLEDTVGNSRGPCNALKRSQKARQRMLTQTANELNKSVSHRFNHYLSKKGGAGRVKVDFSNAELELVINPSAADGAANKVKDIRSLSGGERSFCTLALTLGIGEQIESPFRAMDEFDVFMDAVNRKVSMDALIDFSRDHLNQDKQFLFITPQDISAVDASAPDIRVQKMKGGAAVVEDKRARRGRGRNGCDATTSLTHDARRQRRRRRRRRLGDDAITVREHFSANAIGV